MKKKLHNTVTFIVLAAGAMSFGGCQYAMYLFQPPAKMVTIQPEYKGLEGKTVAVVVWADQRIQYDYPYARLTLSFELQAELATEDGTALRDKRRLEPAWWTGTGSCEKIWQKQT